MDDIEKDSRPLPIASHSMLRKISEVSAWWCRGATPTRRWKLYFYYHVTLALLLSIFAFLDLKRWYPEDLVPREPLAARIVVYCVLAIIFLQAALLPVIAPFLSARLVWLARKGSPSFIAFALCDTAATFLQHFALLILCSG